MSAVKAHVDAKKLLETLAKMSTDARQKLEAKAIRQGLGPILRGSRKEWKTVSVGQPSNKRIRYWAARAIRMTVDRYLAPSNLSPKGRRERYGKVFISYKNKYRAARLAHLLENPRGNYRTSGPMKKGKIRQSGSPGRRYGLMPKSYRPMTKTFDRYKGQARQAFTRACKLFLQGYQAKHIRKTIKGMYG